MDKIMVLDCTLRDGGYVNNWMFGREKAVNIIHGIEESGVDVIECGLLEECVNYENSTKLNSLYEISNMISKKQDVLYAVMLVYKKDLQIEIAPKSKTKIDIIRLAFFKCDYLDAIIYAEKLKDRGYLVYLQAMASQMYNDSELENMITQINKVMPDAFYLVDSFGNMYKSELECLVKKTISMLNKNIMLGFHGHNNLQLALSNAIHFIKLCKERKTIIDSSIFGMGRGSGNVNTELLLHYINNHYNKNYNIEILLIIYDNYLREINNEIKWGYSYGYFLTAIKNINPVYYWKLTNLGLDYNKVDKILNGIPEENSYTLNRELINQLIQSEE